MDTSMNNRLSKLALGFIAPLPIAMGLGLVLSCGGDSGPATDNGEFDDIGFATPTETTTAYTELAAGGWELQGAANWSCLNQPTDEVPSTTDITLTGDLIDFQTEDPSTDSAITLYGDSGITGAELGTATSDSADGKYEVALPSGQTHWAFKVVAEDALDTYTLNQYFAPDQAAQSLEIKSVSLLTAQALPAFIGVTRTPGLGIIAGSIRDCDGNYVKGAIAAVSDVPELPSHVDGGVTYYFSALSTSLPVRHSLESNTNTDGVFVTIELPPGQERYLQVWGFVDDADLSDGEPTLLGQVATPIIADAVVTVSLRPFRQ